MNPQEHVAKRNVRVPAPPPPPGKALVGWARNVEASVQHLLEQAERGLVTVPLKPFLHPLHTSITPAWWGVTKKDLHAFQVECQELVKNRQIQSGDQAGDDDDHIGPSIYVVNEQLIKPKTLEAGGMSWALMCHPEGVQCDIFVTHCWAEGVFEFCRKVQQMWPGPLPHGIYVCFLANPQNGDITSLLQDPYTSPFALALKECRHFLVVPNSRKSIYTRLWCVFEINLATQYDLHIVLPSYPRKTSVAKALLIPAAISLVTFVPSIAMSLVLFFVLDVDSGSTEEIWRFITWMTIPLASLIVCPCMLVARVSIAYFLMAALGCFIAVRVVWWVNHPYELLLPGALLPQGALVARGFGYVIKAIIKTNLDKESALLDMDTVRNASCSSKDDEAKIRAAIAGHEDDIDETISIVRAVGKYSSAVLFNLDRGMGYLRASLGIWPLAIIAGTSFWVLSLGYLFASCDFCDSAEDVGIIVAIWIAMIAMAIIVPLACWFTGEIVILGTDVLLWSGVLQYCQHFTLAFFGEVLEFDSTVPVAVLTVLNLGLSIWCCVHFYSGVYALAKRSAEDTWIALQEAEPCFGEWSRDSSECMSREDDPRLKHEAAVGLPVVSVSSRTPTFRM
mmetsp:Transcript_49011/g.109905  ORF Transcript_49011/g.109905 Transcript_49011/m.109905 type:complete len:620 (+) Transcript_49011:31-1890(+)